MNLAEKIDRLNTECKGTITISHYVEWEIHSYGPGSPFYGHDRQVKDHDLEKCVDLAIHVLEKDLGLLYFIGYGGNNV